MSLTVRTIYLLLLIVLFAACKQTVRGRNGIVYDSPSEYNDYIISRQTAIIKNILALGNTAESDIDSAYSMLDKYTNEASAVINEIKSMPPYKGDSSLRDAAVNSFSFYRKLFNESYKRVLYVRLAGNDVTDEGAAEIVAIMDKIKREEEVLDKKLHNAQRDIADKFKMRMRENEIQKEIDEDN